MKKLWLLIAVMLMALALGPSGALASQIDFSETHNFYLTVYDVTTSTFVTPTTGGNITTAFTDSASYNPVEGTTGSSGPTPIVVNTPSSATASTSAGTWLKIRTTTTSYAGTTLGVGKFGGTISHNFEGLGPNPFTHLNGLIAQSDSKTGPPRTQLLHLVYNGPSSGSDTYQVFFHDTYNLAFAVNQATGSIYPVSYINASSNINVKITNGSSFSNNGNLLYSYTAGSLGSSTPIAGHSDTLTGSTWTYGPNNFLVASGTQLTLDVSLAALYNAQTTTSPVPVPSTLLLLGSGLVGLGLLRRKWSFKK